MPKLAAILFLALVSCGPGWSEAVSDYEQTGLQPGAQQSSDSSPPRVALFVGGQSNATAAFGVDPHPGFPDPSIPELANIDGFDTGPDPVPLGLLGGHHSIELTLAPLLDSLVGVAKVSRGGTALAYWLPEANDPVLWASLLEMRSRAVAAWGSGLRWRFVWIQGESDAVDLTTANAYEARLRHFALLVHAEYGGDFYQVRLGLGLKKFPGSDVVRAAQAKVMAEQPWSHLVDVDSVGVSAFPPHYSSAQLDQIGVLAAEEVKNSL